MDTVNAMWQNVFGRLTKAKRDAQKARNRGAKLSAHSIMLSAYITILDGWSVEGYHPIKFSILAVWHALCLMCKWKKLSHNQLDILIQFLLKIRLWQAPARYLRFGCFLLKLAEAEKRIVNREDIKPHQRALAYMTYAEVVYAVCSSSVDVIERNISSALELEDKIRCESSQPQGLRQLVRIYRKAGELYGTEELSPDGIWATLEHFYLLRALRLAEGEANSPGQAKKIRLLLDE